MREFRPPKGQVPTGQVGMKFSGKRNKTGRISEIYDRGIRATLFLCFFIGKLEEV